MSDLSVFDNKIEESGISYYLFPVDYPLFKAHSVLDKGPVMELRPNKPYFFGLKNTNEDYVESYENEYGVIFEFITTRPYKLVALDDKPTQETLYRDAPEDIKTILENNYGYSSNIRNSVGEKDKIFANYLCSLGYDGYATNVMATDFGGKFHIELLICNTDGLESVGQFTTESRAETIIENGKSRKLANQMKDQRAENKKKRRAVFDDDDEPTFGTRNRLFDDEPNNGLFDDEPRNGLGFGGKRKRKTKRRVNKKKRQTKKRRHSRRRRH